MAGYSDDEAKKILARKQLSLHHPQLFRLECRRIGNWRRLISKMARPRIVKFRIIPNLSTDSISMEYLSKGRAAAKVRRTNTQATGATSITAGRCLWIQQGLSVKGMGRMLGQRHLALSCSSREVVHGIISHECPPALRWMEAMKFTALDRSTRLCRGGGV